MLFIPRRLENYLTYFMMTLFKTRKKQIFDEMSSRRAETDADYFN